ncbi:ABC transporter permease subunit [Paenibacillus sp. J5C_2022]|uniref:PhnE/PtxC family ABC transporter permease n=1 Tax=Paenibacillus sp. J5C2022 TaxID=2977129 RepID=UPI0021CEABE5|nr:ABC transporter permease subunit [Paenibacillus sp. J5C2022]MCU6708652.1 ABC transporter permease subunit [Paenibacillus sp. J5C2022]
MPLRKKPFDPSGFVVKLTLLIVAVLTGYTLWTMDTKDASFLEGVRHTLSNFGSMFGEAHFKHFTFRDAVMSVLITIGLAVVTTLLGAIIALGTGLLAARNISGNAVSQFVKAVMAVIRAVPTILWVLIFAVSSGLGSVAAVLGMTFHTVSYLTKAYSESFEELNPGVLEALQGSGAGKLHIVFQAVLPSSMTYLLSWTFLRLEINFSNALAMGAAAGAGGIGYDMFMASSLYFDIREMGTLTYFILFFAVLLELFSTQLKKRLKSGGMQMNLTGK